MILLRPLRRLFENHTKGELIFPLVVLSALYFFDEFDTAAFGTLAPDIKRAFHLSTSNFTGLVVLNGSLTVLLAVPVGHLADRFARKKMVVWCGIIAGTFSLATGFVGTVALLTVARFGNGVGLLANGAVHNSLLTDYYSEEARPTVLANHSAAVNVGGLIGPALAGGLGALFGWRAVFFVVFIPIIITAIVALRLTEPVRGGTDKGGPLEPLPPLKFWPSAKSLWRIPTLRRIYLACVFIGAGLVPLAAYLPLLFDQVYHLGPLPRGLLGSLGAACTLGGTIHGGVLTPRWSVSGPGVPIRKAGLVVAGVGIAMGGVAASPWLALTIAVFMVGSYITGFFFAPFAVTLALVSPARQRGLSFSLFAIFAVLGAVAFYASGLGAISDHFGMRWGLGVVAPLFLIGGLIGRTASQFVAGDSHAGTGVDV